MSEVCLVNSGRLWSKQPLIQEDGFLTTFSCNINRDPAKAISLALMNRKGDMVVVCDCRGSVYMLKLAR